MLVALLLYRISKADKFLANLIVFYIAVNVVALFYGF